MDILEKIKAIFKSEDNILFAYIFATNKEIDLVVLNRTKNLFLIEDIINNSTLLKDNDKHIEYKVYKWMEIIDFKELDKRLDSA